MVDRTHREEVADGEEALHGGAEHRHAAGAEILAEQWRREYNTNRPHSDLRGMTLREFARTKQLESPARLSS